MGTGPWVPSHTRREGLECTPMVDAGHSEPNCLPIDCDPSILDPKERWRMRDDQKSKEQLIAELCALRAQIGRQTPSGSGVDDDPSAPYDAGPSEPRTRTVFESVQAGILVQAASGAITYANGTAQRVLAYPAEEIQSKTSGDPVWQMILEDGTPVRGEDHPSMITLRTGKPLRDQVRGLFAHAPEYTRWLLINTEPIFHGDEPRPREVIVTFTDITERQQAEQKLRESQDAVRRKLQAILEPEGDLGQLALGDIMDLPAVQSLMNRFQAVTGVGMALLDLAGEVVVASGWQDICVQFHRRHPHTAKFCLESDTILSTGIAPGEYKLYKCKNNLWDIATPVLVGDRHVGKLFIGQFFFEDEEPDVSLFRDQARRNGFDEEAYLAALDRVPRYSRARVDAVMGFYAELTHILSALSMANIKLARINAEKDALVRRLEASEASLKRAQRLARIGSWTYQLANNKPTWSDEAFRIFDVDPKHGEPPWDEYRRWIHPDDVQRIDSAVNRVIDEGGTYDLMLRLVAPGGVCKEIRAIGEAEVDEAGKVVGLSGTVQDLTELRKAQRRLQGIIEATANGFWMLTDDGSFLDINSSGAKMLGYSRDEIVGLHISDVEAIETRDETLTRVAQVKANGHMRFETKHRRKDGSTIDVEVSTTYLPSEDGMFFAFISDISERKWAERERAELEDQLHQSQRMEAVGRLAGGVAHDFNNLLTVIGGYSDLLLGDVNQNDPMREDIEEILRATRSASALTAQLLAFSRRQIIAPRVLDLREKLLQSENMLQRLIGEDIHLRCTAEEDQWTVSFDPGQFDQILVNLVVNARDAMVDGGELTIESKNVALAEPARTILGPIPAGNYVMIEVRDTGCGMDTKDLNRIFEPFFTTKESGRGTGLGLSTVYGILKQNESFINVSSEPGRGTRFLVYVPRSAEGSVHHAAVHSPNAQGGAETILLVEDQEGVRSLCERTLKRLGYNVLTAENGGDALLTCEQYEGKIDIVLTDVVMPKMSGVALAKRLELLQPGLRVLYMSGYTDDAIARHGIFEGDQKYLQKPFRPDELARKVREVLDE
jgi:PAS domain S-box-containing protein